MDCINLPFTGTFQSLVLIIVNESATYTPEFLAWMELWYVTYMLVRRIPLPQIPTHNASVGTI